MSEEELKQLKKKFISGPGHIFNPTPTSHEEAVAHGNSLARSGNYPVGTSDCFNVGISGGCGPDCFVYLEGRCEVSSEMIPRLENEDETKLHYKLYPKDKPRRIVLEETDEDNVMDGRYYKDQVFMSGKVLIVSQPKIWREVKE